MSDTRCAHCDKATTLLAPGTFEVRAVLFCDRLFCDDACVSGWARAQVVLAREKAARLGQYLQRIYTSATSARTAHALARRALAGEPFDAQEGARMRMVQEQFTVTIEYGRYGKPIDTEERELLLVVALKKHVAKSLTFVAAARLGREKDTTGVEESIELENITCAGYEAALKNLRAELAGKGGAR